jgi:hypothetical protein
MTTHRRIVFGLLLIVLGLLAPGDGAAKSCRSACGQEIASCKSTCAVGGRAARRRCRAGCKRGLVLACRQFDGPGCGAVVTQTTLEPVTSTTTTEPAATTTSTTSEPPLATTTTLPGDGVTTGFFPVVHVTSSDVDRTYSLFVPPSYDPHRSYPVVFAFHGDGGTGAAVRDALDLEAQANGAAIFVYPDATDESGRHWTLDATLNPDVRFFLDVIVQLSAEYSLDPARRFATGLSSGGYFVNFLNCTLGTTYLRAIAPHSGSGPYGEDWNYDQDGHFECLASPAAAMLIHGTADDVEFPKLRLCISAGAPLPLDVARKFREKFKRPIHSFYGSSECGGICYDRDAPLLEQGFVGQPMRGLDLELLEQDTRATRVRVRSAAAGDGYFPEPDDERLGHGKFVPDDLLSVSGEGLRIVGRISDVINVAGKKVNPAEVEAELLRFAGVRAAVAFGRESILRNEEVAACVVAGERVSESDLLEHCRSHLSGWQVPKRIFFVEEIPVNERGKVNRRELASRFRS